MLPSPPRDKTAVLRILFDRVKGQRFSEEVGIPIAAGLIVGEALMGVGLTFKKIFFSGKAEETAAVLLDHSQSFLSPFC